MTATKRMTSTTVKRPPSTTVKMPKVAVSSFIAEDLKENGESVRTDCVTPDYHEWDASAIAPPQNRILSNVINSSVSSDPSSSLAQTASGNSLGQTSALNTSSADALKQEEDARLSEECTRRSAPYSLPPKRPGPTSSG